MEQEISLKFSDQLCRFFFFWLFTPASLTESCSFWYGSKELFPLHKLDDRQKRYKGRVSARAFTGRFRSEWVNSLGYNSCPGTLPLFRCELLPTKMRLPSSLEYLLPCFRGWKQRCSLANWRKSPLLCETPPCSSWINTISICFCWWVEKLAAFLACN